MSFPAHAHRSFEKCKDKLYYLTATIIKKLKALNSPIERARLAHRETQKYINEIIQNPIVKKYMSCKKGCTACCYSQVAVTSDEAILLADLVKKGVKIDYERLKKQADQGNNYRDWYNLNYKDRSCVFLSDKGACQIYDDRPLVCRTNMVLSDPQLCDTKDGKLKPIRLIDTDKPNMIIIGAYEVADSSGTLAKLLFETLNQQKRIQRKPKKSLIVFAKPHQDD